jgi:hypothetical protein
MFRVAAHGGLDLRMTIAGLDGPGNYKGALRFTAPDRKPLDVPFELALRLAWPWAAAAIAFGAILAAVLRYFQQTAQPRLLLQREALVLRSKLVDLKQAESADLAPRETQGIDFLTQQLDTASNELAEGVAIPSVQARIDRVRLKLPLLPSWIVARRRHDAVSPPSVAAVIEPDLDAVFDVLTAGQAVTAADARLEGIEAKIKNAIRDRILPAVKEISDAVDQYADPDKLEFDPVGHDLTAAETEANALHLDPSRDALDRARAGFVEIAARLLRRKLDRRSPQSGLLPRNGPPLRPRSAVSSMRSPPNPTSSGGLGAGATSTGATWWKSRAAPRRMSTPCCLPELPPKC